MQAAELLLITAIVVAVFIATKVINAVNNSSPEERFLQTFKIPYGASQWETERAFRSSFIRAKSPLSKIYGELRFLEDRDDLTEEESEKKANLKKEEVKVLQALQEILDIAFRLRPREAKRTADELRVFELLSRLEPA